MELFSTSEFDKDYKKSSKEDIKRINRLIAQLKRRIPVGKPLRHLKNTFSVRVGNKRLVYTVEGDKLTLLFFKSREGVYDYLM
ncbi:type II toxin-antitoxin system YoeB family toxin [Candidatus Marsarchaeota archaeon]|jgi:mRNA-degrading endonuclease RelE of RelBE toxin-antitoxin system|nr:type II toxin-antitoxin system YoeB family toxin [Candidatus Marsarchaeota archaeon]MCL5092506.1 type II toxin-antitoxin system YoeB family toxin [Candidatus Marsarchaeota archaeon]